MDSATATSTRLTIEVWADVVCPWCYVGEQRLHAAIERSGHAGQIDLQVRTFQLDPSAPATTIPTLEYLSRKFGVPLAQARSMEEDMAQRAQAEGLAYSPDRPSANTLDMLRLVHLASAHGVGWEYLRAVQAELFSGQPDAFEPATLVRLGEQLGVPSDESRSVLAGDRFADAVRADHEEALRLGANGVPFTVLGRRVGVPGSVSTEQFAAAIEQAWEHVSG